jgi:hypothetical protein
LFQLLIAKIWELYPQMCVGFSRGKPMTLPEDILLKRRLATAADMTGKAQPRDARQHEHEDRAHQDASLYDDTSPHEDTSSHEDTWVTNFIGRLAGLVRNVGGRK